MDSTRDGRRAGRHGARRIVVVPLLVASYSGHYDQIRYPAGLTDSLDGEMKIMLAMSGIARASGAVPLTVARALDDSPELAHVLAARARARATDPPHQALFLFGHGPNSRSITRHGWPTSVWWRTPCGRPPDLPASPSS